MAVASGQIDLYAVLQVHRSVHPRGLPDLGRHRAAARLTLSLNLARPPSNMERRRAVTPPGTTRRRPSSRSRLDVFGEEVGVDGDGGGRSTASGGDDGSRLCAKRITSSDHCRTSRACPTASAAARLPRR